MKANSEKTKQSKKATRRVLAGVLCGASVLSLVLSLVMPPISQAIANDTQTVSTEEAVTGSSSSESAAVDNTSEDAENQNSAATSANAATTVNKGIYKPTSIGIGTNIDISTPRSRAWPPTSAATCTSVVSRTKLALLMRITPPPAHMPLRRRALPWSTANWP